MKKTAKSTSIKSLLFKPESERTQTQKIVRDVAFFAVVIYAAVISFLYFDAETQVIELDCANYSPAAQVAMNR